MTVIHEQLLSKMQEKKTHNFKPMNLYNIYQQPLQPLETENDKKSPILDQIYQNLR